MYTHRKKARLLSPERHDVFEDGSVDEQANVTRTYAEIMNQQRIDNERAEI